MKETLTESARPQTARHLPQAPARSGARKSLLRRPIAYVALVVIAVSAGGAEVARRSLAPVEDLASGGTARARRDNLVITVVEGGSLRAKESVDVISRVENNATILFLVPEGKSVEKGEKLIELDSAELRERKVQEDAQLSTTRADYLAAEEAFAIQQNQRESEIKRAELAVQFADTDLNKFLEGDRPQQRQKAEADITIAKQELERDKGRLFYTERLEKEGIVTRQELEADRLAVQKSEIALAQAQEAQRLLEKFEFPKQEAKLRSDLEEAHRELDRVSRRTASEVAQKKAALDAKKTNYEFQQQRVKKIQEQIDNTTILAPQAGMAVYWTPRDRWSQQRPPEIGGQVRHRQTILTLPDTSKMEVDVQIHESQIDRVREGQRAAVVIDAFPDRKFTGEVKKIAVMADSARFFNPDVKVYTTVISIDQSTEGLKPGMSAQVEIMADILKDRLLVPVTGVHVIRGRTAAIVRTSAGLAVREVKVGPTNDRFVVVESGLQEGDEVLLYEPKVMPVIPWTEEKKAAPDLPETPQPPPDRRPAAQGAPAERASPAGGRMSPEQMEAWRKRYEEASPEEQKRMMEEAQRRRSQRGTRGPGASGERPATPSDAPADSAAPAPPSGAPADSPAPAPPSGAPADSAAAASSGAPADSTAPADSAAPAGGSEAAP